MHLVDWLIVIAYLSYVIWHGLKLSRGTTDTEGFFLAGRSLPWWAVGLSVMATQMSAITLIGTTGQAYEDGMRFIQFYFGLPLAMIILCVTAGPLFYRARVFTAYEYLEQRFDAKTRTLTSFFFLLSRGLGAGVIIAAPAVVLSIVLGWDELVTIFVIGLSTTVYTMLGGVQSVTWTDVKQMVIILVGLSLCVFVIITNLPAGVSFNDAMNVAGAAGKLQTIDFTFDLTEPYTIWSGMIAALFLFLSYFGCDQSQVQRYLSGKSMKEMQMGLIFNGLLKIPMQFFILLVGVMVFVFYQFNSSPLHFNPSAVNDVLNSPYAAQYQDLQEQKNTLEIAIKEQQLNYAVLDNQGQKQTVLLDIKALQSQEDQLRISSKELIKKANPKAETNDKDYVFIHFILNNLPRGLIGLLLAVILSAAMSSTASELNALGSTTTIDLYRRNNQGRSDKHYLMASKGFTMLWGIIAIGVACVANLFENLIELVNIIGSIFYGNVLGIFLLAFFFTYVKSRAVFIAAIITQGIIVYIWWIDLMPYLWLNVVGATLVIAIAFILQVVSLDKNKGLEV